MDGKKTQNNDKTKYKLLERSDYIRRLRTEETRVSCEPARHKVTNIRINPVPSRHLLVIWMERSSGKLCCLPPLVTPTSQLLGVLETAGFGRAKV